ncbi:hypothetical protein M5K25_012066 [Dendrobium thyrsiflorum]|uniref:Uncharacterized protein n=1 Tax=Dendrobium thyrsiflorum TaxID=117978 RepID=A0ABD0UWK4_DENTH
MRAEEEGSLHEDDRVEHLRLAVDLEGEGLHPVALVLVVESPAVVVGSHFEILPSFGYTLPRKDLKFLPQQCVAPRDRKRLILDVHDSWIDSRTENLETLDLLTKLSSPLPLLKQTITAPNEIEVEDMLEWVAYHDGAWKVMKKKIYASDDISDRLNRFMINKQIVEEKIKPKMTIEEIAVANILISSERGQCVGEGQACGRKWGREHEGLEVTVYDKSEWYYLLYLMRSTFKKEKCHYLRWRIGELYSGCSKALGVNDGTRLGRRKLGRLASGLDVDGREIGGVAWAGGRPS